MRTFHRNLHRLTCGLLLAGLLLAASPAVALRCGSDLVNEGDLKFQVLQVCGEPLSREFIGFSESPARGSREFELLLEEWIYAINSFYYRMVFEGNRLILIESVGRRNR